jgi:hypothetical protein
MCTEGFYAGGKAAGVWSWPLTSISPTLKMRGVIPPLPDYVLMAGHLVKHKNNFTFTFYLVCVCVCVCICICVKDSYLQTCVYILEREFNFFVKLAALCNPALLRTATSTCICLVTQQFLLVLNSRGDYKGENKSHCTCWSGRNAAPD